LSLKDLGTERHKELSKIVTTDGVNVNSHTKALTSINTAKTR